MDYIKPDEPATVLNLFNIAKENASSDAPARVGTDPTMDDLAFAAKRLIVNAISQVKWTDLSVGAQAMYDEGDVKIVERLIDNAVITVEIAGY